MISLTNILVAFLAMIASLATPEDTGIYGAFGTEASCKAMGATFHFIFVVSMGCNAALAIYYYMSVRSNLTAQLFARKIEPWLHVIPCLYALAGVIVGLSFHFYAPHDMFLYCWAAPSPLGCRYDANGAASCEAGNNHRALFVLLSGLIEMNLLTGAKIFCTFVIYYKVSKQQKLMQAKYHAEKTGNTIARETGIQAVLFFGACVIPYGLMIVLRLMDLFFWQHDTVSGTGFFVFSLIAQGMFPLQGVMNMFCYFRPKVIERQRKRSQEGMLESLSHILNLNSTHRLSFRESSLRNTAPKNRRGAARVAAKASSLDVTSSTSTQDAIQDLENLSEVPVDEQDLAYMDIEKIEKDCGHKCSIVPGEDMVGDAQESFQANRKKWRSASAAMMTIPSSDDFMTKSTPALSTSAAKRISFAGDITTIVSEEAEIETETSSNQNSGSEEIKTKDDLER